MSDQTAPQLPQPAPTTVAYVLSRSSGKDNQGVTHQFVQIAFYTSTGVTVFFMPLEFAKRFANEILMEAVKPDPAIQIARQIPPSLNGMDDFMKRIKGE